MSPSASTFASTTRPVSAYVRGHIPQAYHVELRPVFAAWVGWVVPFGTPIIFISDASRAPEEAVRQLRRIGYDELPGYLEGGMAAWEAAGLPIAHTPVLTMREVREGLERQEPLVVLDIRQDPNVSIRGSGRVEAIQQMSMSHVPGQPER